MSDGSKYSTGKSFFFTASYSRASFAGLRGSSGTMDLAPFPSKAYKSLSFLCCDVTRSKLNLRAGILNGTTDLAPKSFLHQVPRPTIKGRKYYNQVNISCNSTINCYPPVTPLISRCHLHLLV